MRLSSRPGHARRAGFAALALAAAVLSLQAPAAAQPAPAAEAAHALAGLWEASKTFGPWAQGELVIRRDGEAFSGQIRGRTGPAVLANGELRFDLGTRGRFIGRFEGRELRGFWLTPPGVIQFMNRASPVTLRQTAPGVWTGEVRPLEDRFSLFLLNRPQPDGTVSAFLRNPDRDQGVQTGVRRIVLDGSAVRLMGGRRNQPETEVAKGTWDAERRILTVTIPGRGGTYDFHRAGDDSDFYPRGRTPERYVYRRPLQRDDGWPTASLEEAGIDRALIERAVQALIDTPAEDYNTPQVEALLIARGGKLVLEEYFHGLDRDRLHETRSASKVLATTLAGAVIQDGAPLSLESRVYQVMNGGTFPEGLEPRKRAMTLDHLLTMAGGYYCDDNDDKAPGNENYILDEVEEDDFWKYSLAVPMAWDPGQKVIYCSMNPNLALGVIAHATGESPLYSFDRLVARPMKIDRYSWNMDRAGNVYGGGGAQFTPRDFIKFGQLMLNEGTWEGRRILPRDFASFVAGTPLIIDGTDRQYGRLWWGFDWTWRGRTVPAYAALGAGGQNVIVVPELDLVIGSFSSNYLSAGQGFNTSEQTPNRILPAVSPR